MNDAFSLGNYISTIWGKFYYSGRILIEIRSEHERGTEKGGVEERVRGR